jgi:hypothetical protein
MFKIFEAIVSVVFLILSPLLIIAGISITAFVVFAPFMLSLYVNSSGPGHSDGIFWTLVALCLPWALTVMLILLPIFSAVNESIQENKTRKERNRFQPRIMPDGYETASDIEKKRMEMDYWHQNNNYEYVTSTPAKRIELAEKDWSEYRRKWLVSDANKNRY